jgi:FAD/FMN-containing dehydrogenase
LHFNKGQAGASAEALAAGRETAMNPSVFDAEALVIIAAEGHIVPGVSGPDEEEAESAQEGIAAAIGIIRAATPGSGSYVNETDWFEADWQRSFWGENYDRLAAIKRKYDPDGLFYCHHCVGSESWSEGGFCKLPP